MSPGSFDGPFIFNVAGLLADAVGTSRIIHIEDGALDQTFGQVQGFQFTEFANCCMHFFRVT